MNGLDLLLAVLVVIGVLYAARWLDEWEEERELDWLWDESLRRAGLALDGGALTERGGDEVAAAVLDAAKSGTTQGCSQPGFDPRSVSVFDQEAGAA